MRIMAKKNKRLWRFADFENMMYAKRNSSGSYTWLPFTIEKKK